MSVYERDYMQDGPPGSGGGFPKPSSAVVWLLVINVAVFLVQNIFAKWFGSPTFDHLFALSSDGLSQLMVWQFVTYGFLHASPFHLIVNGLVIFFIGRAVEPVLGFSRFFFLYFSGVLVGSCFWLVWNLNSFAPLMGASAGAMALLIFFCCHQPNRPITFFIFFVIPVTMKPKYVAYAVLAIDAFGFLFTEITGGSGGIAHSAHLGGMLAGFLVHRFLYSPNPIHRSSGGVQMERPGWVKKAAGMAQKSSGEKPKYTINIKSRSEMEKEVDRILDKINQKGFGSLSVEEKAILDRAKDLLKK